MTNIFVEISRELIVEIIVVVIFRIYDKWTQK